MILRELVLLRFQTFDDCATCGAELVLALNVPPLPEAVHRLLLTFDWAH